MLRRHSATALLRGAELVTLLYTYPHPHPHLHSATLRCVVRLPCHTQLRVISQAAIIINPYSQLRRPVRCTRATCHRQPRVTEVSLLRLGPLLVACLPGEPSTMAGRRIKAALRQRFAAAVPPVRHVVISGLTGTYSSYITTFEEYQVMV